MRLFSLVLIFVPTIAFGLEIPESCKPLALREGYPLVMSDSEAQQAKARMQNYKNDPLVMKCLDAISKIERMKKMGK